MREVLVSVLSLTLRQSKILGRLYPLRCWSDLEALAELDGADDGYCKELFQHELCFYAIFA